MTAPRRLRRALILLPSMALGGAEVMTATLARFLAAEGIALDIAIEPSLLPGFATMLGPALADSLSAAPLGWRQEEPDAQNLRRQGAIAAARIMTVRPDAAILPLPWPTHGAGFLGPLAEARIPTLAISHLAPEEPEPGMAALAQAVPCPPSVAWAAVSPVIAARIAALYGGPASAIAVVPNGVAIPRLAPEARDRIRRVRRDLLLLPRDAPLFLTVGRLEPKKGTDLLPGLALALRDRLGRHARVVALGDGPMAETLAAHPAAAPGHGPLRLLGQVDDVGEWMLAADALVLPSRLEGHPLVFLEAAARRCPVVAMRAALEGLGEAVWDLAAIAEDDMASGLTDHAVATFIAPSAARLRVAAAFDAVRRWDEAAMLRRYHGLLRAIVAG